MVRMNNLQGELVSAIATSGIEHWELDVMEGVEGYLTPYLIALSSTVYREVISKYTEGLGE